MSGLFVAGLIAGPVADFIGRKPVYFISVLGLVVLNTGAAFSTSWEIFTVLRFFIGFCIGSYLTVFYTFFVEFLPMKYRPLAVTFPVWPIGVALMALVGWWIPDWRKLHIATAIVSLPTLFFWW